MKTYTYKEAQELILKALKPLGEEYLNLLRTGFENRWIDIYENEGKEAARTPTALTAFTRMC